MRVCDLWFCVPFFVWGRAEPCVCESDGESAQRSRAGASGETRTLRGRPARIGARRRVYRICELCGSCYFLLFLAVACACCCVVLRVTRAGPKKWGAGAGARCGGGGRGRDDKQIDGLGAVPRDPSEPQNAENSGGEMIDLLRSTSSSFLYRFNTISLFTVDYGLHRLVSCVR